MSNEIYESMIQSKGAAYRDSQIKSYSHYLEPIDHGNGRLAGNSRVWGDASPEVQSGVIDELIRSSKEAGLTQRQTAQVLAIARIESGFNPDAAAGTTSASGLGQFIDKTGNHYGLDNGNRFDVGKQADALVAHYIDNMNLAKSRGQGEEYIYKYHHDGPTSDYGGLALSRNHVMPYVNQYEQFVKQHWDQQVGQRHIPDSNSVGGTTTSPASAHAELKHGDKSVEVEQLQKRLNDLGYTDAAGNKLSTDRNFGNHTKEAVEQFQRENGLKVTGIADKDTLHLVDKGMTRHAAADGQLQPGEKGPDVRGLQENLNQLGLAGANGKPLKVDGDYGDNTRDAVRKFQQANGLSETGTADRTTLEKLGEQVKLDPKVTAEGRVTAPVADAPPATNGQNQPQQPSQADKPSMADPKHPDNAMYKQALANLEQLGPGGGFKSREELERAAAAVTADARASGLASIDHIAKTNAASGNQTLLVAVQGDPTNPASKNSYIDYNQAVTQTVDQSSRMAEATRTQQAQQPDMPQQEQPRVAVGAR